MSHRVCYITPSVVQLWGCIANVYAMLSFGGAAEQRSSGRVTSLYGSVAAALKVSVRPAAAHRACVLREAAQPDHRLRARACVC